VLPGIAARWLLSVFVLFASACSHATLDTRDDFTITARVKTELLNESALAGLRLDVETYKGVVTLSGAVNTAADRDRAIAVARKVPGVRDVTSALKVGQVSS